MSEEDDEFEDAMETIAREEREEAERRRSQSPPQQDEYKHDTSMTLNGMHPSSRPATLGIPIQGAAPLTPAGAPPRALLFSPTAVPYATMQTTPHFAAPHPVTSTPQEASASRRNRLTALRTRMKEEFGAREGTPLGTATGDGDSCSLASEATSIHSWHRRVLAGPETVIVHPSDSVSTRAVSSTGPPTYHPLWSPMSNEAASSIGPIREDRESVDTDNDPSPVAQFIPASSPLSHNIRSPVGPPPSHPPPALPARPVIDPRCPPPLPPRNPSIRLPDPVAAEVVARLSKIDDEDSFHTPLSKKSSENMEITPRSQRVSVNTNSNDSITSIGENGIVRRKGHTKTNSLDRGMTLAKSVKTGPFPPPTNKSNSLTRQELDGEEEERNSAAEGVIRQITTGLLDQKMDCSDHLEPIASGSSSISSPSSVMSKDKSRDKKKKTPKKTPAVAEEREREERLLKEMTEKNKENEMIDNTVRFQCSSRRVSPLLVMAEDSCDFRLQSPSISSSIDPITRDVERRMSMKRDGTLPGDERSEHDSSDGFASTRSGIDHAKSIARNYGTLASGLFKGAFQKVKNVAHVGASTSKPVEDDTSDSEAEHSESGAPPPGQHDSIVRPRKAKKGPYDFEQLRMVQELDNEHTGAVWCVRFSVCGRLMATAGQDSIVRIWVVSSHLKYFSEMRERYQQKTDAGGSASDVFESTLNDMESFRPPSSADSIINSDANGEGEDGALLMSAKPFAVFKGHTADILDLSWSKNYFILSSGMDRTVKLWHLSRNECLCCFQHVDFVTCVAFLPKDDRYFLSGSLDGKLRLWHIPDKRVAVWNEVQVKFITAITFVKNGKFAVVGTYNGRCYFYTTDQLKYHTVVDVRSTRGKNARGHKVTGLAVHGDKLLVTSNDSRIRMYDVRDKTLKCKFRGAQNEHSQIRAAFSPDGRHIVCGSEDRFIYMWRTSDLPSSLSVRKDRNAMWERCRVHSAPVSVAVFAPKPQVFLSLMDKRESSAGVERAPGGQVIVSADLQGSIKILVNRPRLTKAGHSTFFNTE